MVVRDNAAHQVPVEVGVREGDRVQITKGLNSGETVIVSGGYALPDNTKVKIAEAAAQSASRKPTLAVRTRTEGMSVHSTLERATDYRFGSSLS